MQSDPERPRVGYRGSVGSRAQSLIVKTVVVAGAAVMLVSAVAVSIAIFAVTLAGLFVFGAYFWWKTRDLRKQMRSQTHSRFEQGDVIDAVVIREVEVRRREKR
jgi:hypothetical protein